MSKGHGEKKANGVTDMTEDILEMISDTEIIMDVEVDKADEILKIKRMTSVDMDKNITK